MTYTSKDLTAAVKAVNDAVALAETISEAIGEGFSLDIAYGMGGWYEPMSRLLTYDKVLEKIEKSEFDEDDLEMVKELIEEYQEEIASHPNRTYVFDLGEGALRTKGRYDDDELGGWRSSSSSC